MRIIRRKRLIAKEEDEEEWFWEKALMREFHETSSLSLSFIESKRVKACDK